MKKISEMTLEELQDYAVTLEADKKELSDKLTEKESSLTEAHELNRQLQKRNNDLFMKVEQQYTPPALELEKEEKTETCEEFAQKLVNGGKF